jgi:hypothetical protein
MQHAAVSAFDDCERQLLELEALASIFDQEFVHGDQEAHALVAATHESCEDAETAFQWGDLPRLSAVVQLPHCVLRLQLPHRYPSSAPAICSIDAPPGGDPSVLVDLTDQAISRVGQESLLFLIEQCRDHCQDVVMAMQEEGDVALALQLSLSALQLSEANAAESSVLSSTAGERVFGRRCIYSHHIIASSKRAAVMQGALERGLSGCSKIGWPGVIVIEGPEDQCKSYVRMLSSLRWKCLVVRGEESFPIEDGQTVEELRAFPPGFREFGASDMSALAAYCREHGVHDLFLTVLKKHRG